MSKSFSSTHFLHNSLIANLVGVRLALALLVMSLLAMPLLSGNAQARDYQFFDAEIHYQDAKQATDGMDFLLENMEKASIEKALITGFSVTKKWASSSPRRPFSYGADDAPVYWYSATDMLVYDAVKSLPEREQSRFYPFITGFNPTDLNAVDHIERLLKRDPGFWKGIGEVFTRHDLLSAMIEGERPLAHHPALMRVYQLAAKYGLPVMLHSNLTSPVMKEFIYLPELELALETNPKTTFIWAHAGLSDAITLQQTVEGLPELVAELLGKYQNLNILLSWTVVDALYDAEGVPKTDWLEVVKSYPNRFVIGSDVVGGFSPLKETMDHFRPFLDALPEEVAHRVASTNLLQWLP